MIDVWVVDSHLFGTVPRALLNILDLTEEERSTRIRSGVDRRQFLIGRILLRQALSRALGGDPRSWKFITGQTGKVNLAHHEGMPLVDFNISHSGNAVAVAVSTEGQVGLDIEVKDPKRFEAPVDVVFTRREVDYLESQPARLRWNETMRLWTMKEAYAKLIGLGFEIDFSSFEVWPEQPSSTYFDTRDLIVGDAEYRMTLATTKPRKASMRVMGIGQSDLLTEKTTVEPAFSLLMNA